VLPDAVPEQDEVLPLPTKVMLPEAIHRSRRSSSLA
jgi:hypothetical protein